MTYKYIVYKTTNLINNKIYIGVHRTDIDKEDPYIGCGIFNDKCSKKKYLFHKAVAKYGYKNFKRETLFEYPDTEEGKLQAYKKEAELVNKEFLKRKDVYNSCLGGKVQPSILNKPTDNIEPAKIRTKVVYQFDLQGNYITYYKSLHDASKATGIPYQVIGGNCLGKQTCAGGYFWSYKKRFEFDPNKVRKTAIACYTDDGKFIESFDSIIEASKKYNVNHSCIISCIQGKTKHSGKVRWRYFYGNTSNISSL